MASEKRRSSFSRSTAKRIAFASFGKWLCCICLTCIWNKENPRSGIRPGVERLDALMIDNILPMIGMD